MIIEIKKYIDEKKFVSLLALAQHFQSDISAIEKIMEPLIEKGYVKKIDGSKRACAGCLSPCADPSQMIYYEKVF